LPLYCFGGLAFLYVMAIFIPPTYILNRIRPVGDHLGGDAEIR
jgi:hypothetical protein